MIDDSMPDEAMRIFVAGDVLNFGVSDGILCEDALAEVVTGADYSICNFEAPVHSEAKADKTVGPVRSQVKATLAGLKGQGFDCVLLANNHMFDYGVVGFSETAKEAARVGLDFLGAGRNQDAAYEPLLKTVKGYKVAFINACEAQHGVLDHSANEDDAGYAWILSPRVDALVTSLRESCDFVVVLAHAGLEESPVPQWQWKSRYRALCDKGADAVIASHPHVPQGYELYNGKLIAYSLGNFYFDSPKYARSPDHSYSLLIELCKGRGIKVNVVPHYKEAGKVRIDRNQLLDVVSLCELLNDDYGRLEADRNEETLAILKRSLRLSTTPFPFDRGVKSVLGRLLSILRGKGRPADKDALLLHLLRNESYRYAAISALEQRMKRSRP